jgi:hypothetical protein
MDAAILYADQVITEIHKLSSYFCKDLTVARRLLHNLRESAQIVGCFVLAALAGSCQNFLIQDASINMSAMAVALSGELNKVRQEWSSARSNQEWPSAHTSVLNVAPRAVVCRYFEIHGS